MQAIEAARFGGPEVLALREAPDPVAGPGEVVIAVAAADTLWLETAVRRSPEFAADWDLRTPYIPGCGVSGRVIAAGDGVGTSWIGRRVTARTGLEGGYAERVAVPAETLIPVPDGLGLREAAALLHDGATLVGVFEPAGVKAGEHVLILAAGGGLGILLVQAAHAAGARVIGAARGKRKLDLILEQGADVVVDYSEPGWIDQVRAATGPSGPEVVFDGAGGEAGRAAFEITATGGRFSAHGAQGGFTVVDPEEAERRRISVRGIADLQFDPPLYRRYVEKAYAEAVAGRLRPLIGQTFPLAEAAAAHTAIETRNTVGKTLILVGSAMSE